MGSSHSVIWGSKQREDISYSDIEYKHSKLWNTLAPRDDHLSLTSVSNFNAAKINSPIYKEPIYRGPGAGQQMVVSPCFLNYRVENTLSSEELDQLDRIQKNVLPNEQPKYPNFNLIFPNPVSSTINPNPPWFKNEAIHEDHQDVNADGKFKNCPTYTNINAEDTRTLVSGEPKFNHDAIHLDYQKLCISSNPHTVLRSSYYKSDFNLIFPNPVPSTINPNPPWFKNEAIHEDHQDVNTGRKFRNCPTYTNIKAGLNFPNPVPSTIIPNPRCFNNEAIHEDHQDLNANRNSRKRPLSTNNKSDNRAAAGLKAFSILLLLTSPAAAYPVSVYPVSAYPVSQGHQVEIKCLQDSDKNLNCTLQIDNKYILCYGHCDQNLIHHQHIYDDTVENLLVNVSKQHENAMEVNQISLMKTHNLSSGNFELIFLWEFDKVFNNSMNETIQNVFNDKKLTDEEMTDLPMTSKYFLNCDPNSPEYMEKMKDYVKGLWESIREKILPFLKIDDQPGTTESWVIAVSTVIPVSIIFILIFIVLSRKYGMKSCKTVTETICKAAYGQVSQTEAQGSPNWMEAPEREDMTSSV